MSSPDQPRARDEVEAATSLAQDGWLRLPASRPADHAVKSVKYHLPVYEQLLGHLRTQAFTLLELGVWAGHSLEMWRDAFPRATIIGVDLAPPDLPLGPRVHIVCGDQADAALMRRLRQDHAPAGFDVIIDDASHFGITTAQSLQILYSEHLRRGGLYCIEDWGTGYLPKWPDGGRIAAPLDVRHLDSSTKPPWTDVAFRLRRALRHRGARRTRPFPGETTPIPMASHDIGMVGVIKRLVDHTGSDHVRKGHPDLVGDLLAIDSMTVWRGLVALRKPSG